MSRTTFDSLPDLYVVRHGETRWNREGRFQGHADIELNMVGKAQAAKMALRLEAMLSRKGSRPEGLQIITSPLKRATATAAIISRELGIAETSIQCAEELREVSFGAWEGMTTLEVKEQFYDQRRMRKSDRWHFRPPGGQSLDDAESGIVAFLSGLEMPSIIVCHTGAIRIMLHVLGGYSRATAAENRIGHEQVFVWSGGTFKSH